MTESSVVKANSRRPRPRTLLAALAVAVLALTGLTACKSNLGVAATVNGARIDDSQLAHQVTPSAKPVQISQTASLSPRAFALSVLIGNKILPDIVAKGPSGGPGKTDLAEIRTRALGGKSTSAYATAQGVRGFTASFDKQVVTYIVYLQVLRAYQANNINIPNLIRSAKPSVHVSPRYGAWDESSLLLSTAPNAGLPGFVTLQPTAGAGAGTQAVQVPDN